MIRPRTAFKVREAAFFLAKLREEDRRAVLRETEAFSFYLSAFLSAAISATWMLRLQKDQSWYGRWKAALDPRDQDLLEFIDTQRDEEVHRRGAEVERSTRSVDARLVAPSRVIIFSPPLALLAAEAERTGGQLDPKDFVPWIEVAEFAFKDAPETPAGVIALCERILSLLRRMVAEYDAEHQ